MSVNDEQLSQQLEAGVLAASPDCVKILSSDGVVQFVNAIGVDLFELASRNDLIGQELASVWPLEEQEKVRAAIRGASAGKVTQIEGFCPTGKGSPRWWEVRFAPVPAVPGKPPRIVGISRDVTGRREAELTRRANEEQFSLLLESSGDGIYGTDSDGNCTFINAAGAVMLGYHPKRLIGLSLHEIIHHLRPDGSAYPLSECHIFKAAQSGQSSRVDDEVFWHKDGHAVPVTYSVFPMVLDGRRMGAVVTFSDTTERRRVERDLRQLAAELSEADRRKTEFLATLAHELRNPLAPLRNGLEILRKSGGDPSTAAKIHDMMQRQLSQMVHLVNDLLDIARITSGKMELKQEIVELGLIITSAIEASDPLIQNSGHRLIVDMPEQRVFINADITRMTQVLGNLLNNAARYSAPGGRITLSGRVVDDHVEIQVSDTGVGIQPGSLSAIFEMFTQVGREVHQVPGGLGIGLNLVRRIVELHGGSATASSPGIDKGSVFTVRLPVVEAPSRDTHASAPREGQPKTEPLQILVVDDNVDSATSMAMLLGLGEHIVRVAHSGAEALKVLASFHPALVLLDIGMPDMNGYEVAKEVRKLPALRETILVALTGWGGEGDRQRSAAAGFDDHLVKPADFDAIERLLQRIKR